MPVMTQWMDGLKAWWAAATPATRAMATGLALLVVVGLCVAASLAASPDYRPIYHGVSGKDAAAIETVLRDHSIPMRFDDKDGTISVPGKDEGNAHMYIESANILSKDSAVVGIESLKNLGFGISSQNESQQILAANEGELSRKLMRLDPVQSAAVSITLPSTSAFVGTDKPPTAAVLLTLKPGETLSNLQVKGIVNLVAHSVTDLTPANVTLTDQSGVPLWTDNGTGDPGTDEPSKKNAQFSETEGKRLQAMLDSTFGPHKTVVTVTAELNFDQIHKDETDHPVPPGGAAGTIVSTRTSEENYSGTGAPPAVGGVAGSGSNLNAPSYQTGGAASGGGKYTKTDTTENHETNVSHTVTNVAPGAVRKESVAALIDTSVPADSLPKIKDIIASAILAQPNDPSRFVSVQQITFDTSAAKAQDALLKTQASQVLMGNIARALAVCVVAVVLLVLLTKGSAGRKGVPALTAAEPQLALAGGGANVGYLDAEAPDLEMAAILGHAGPSSRDLAQMAEERPLTVEDVLSEMPEPEGRPRRRARAPSIEEQQDLKMESIRTMVSAHPESVALLMKGWMADDTKVS